MLHLFQSDCTAIVESYENFAPNLKIRVKSRMVRFDNIAVRYTTILTNHNLLGQGLVIWLRPKIRVRKMNLCYAQRFL